MRIINKIGNEELLNREKSLFLCSKHAPYSVYDKVFGWVDSLTADDCTKRGGRDCAVSAYTITPERNCAIANCTIRHAFNQYAKNIGFGNIHQPY